MTFRSTIFAAPALVAMLGAFCVSCNSEAKAPPPANTTSAKPTATAKPAPNAVVFEDDFERVRIEAESAVKIEGKVMRIAEDKSASGGKCIEIPDKAGKPEEGKFARAIYKFKIKKPGLYTFWCRRKWFDQCGDTFAVRFDKAGQPRNLKTEALFGADDSSQPPRWGWSPVFQKGKPRQFFLDAGDHTMELLNREDGPKCDVFLLTSDRDYVPQGLEE